MKVYEGLAALLKGKYLDTCRGMGGLIEDVSGSVFTFRIEKCSCPEHGANRFRMTENVTHTLDVNDPEIRFDVKIQIWDADNKHLFTIDEFEDLEKVRICVGDNERIELIIGAYDNTRKACQKYSWFENHKGNAEWIGNVLAKKPEATVGTYSYKGNQLFFDRA
jgi:hypothetical protein